METLREAKMMDVAEILRYDTHIAPDVLTHRMRDGLVWLAEVDGTIVGVLRFVILWESIRFLNFYISTPPIADAGSDGFACRNGSGKCARSLIVML